MFRFCFAAVLAASLVWATPSQAAPTPPAKKPQVEVVFVLDTTGSMSGLLEAAKQKIWSISNQIANGKPTPFLKIGLVAYRDRGDKYITQIFEMTDDLDTVHGNLMKFAAQGGGDGPESVNQALDDAVGKIKWSEDKKTLRIIFLVGDAPPHMDYKDDTKYPETCKKAIAKNIIINTIQCGGNANTTKIWRDICAKAEGSFVQIAQSGGVVAIATPFDKRLSELNAKIASCTLCWGGREKQMADLRKNRFAEGLEGERASARIAYQAKNQMVAAYDLIDNIKQGKVKLTDLKEAELPEQLRKVKPKERTAYLEKLDKERKEIMKEVVELDKKRNTFLMKKRAELAKKGTEGFDQQVLEVIRGQAKRTGIDY